MAATPRKGAPPSFEDAYLKLRDENNNLKREYTQAQDTIRRLTAKMVMIEETLRRATDGSAAQRLIAAEHEITELRSENESLKRRNKVLSEKLRMAEETLRVRSSLHGAAVEPGRVPRPGSGRVAHGVGGAAGMRASGGSRSTPRAGSARSTSRGAARSRSRSRSQSRSPSASNPPGEGFASPASHAYSAVEESKRPSSTSPPEPVAGIAMGRSSDDESRRALASMQAHIAALARENEALRQRGAPDASAAIVAIPRVDAIELERQLRDKTAQVLLLRSRFEHLEAKSQAERELYDRAVTALEEQNAALRDTRAALQSAEADAALLRSRMRAAAEVEDELRKARDENRRLEALLTELADSPFMHDGKEALTIKQRLDASAVTERQLREQVAHLQQSLRSHHSELQASRQDREDLQTAVDALKDELAGVKATLDATTRANVLLRERLALYGGNAALDGVSATPGDVLSIPPDELERALTLVRKRLDRPSAMPDGSVTAGILDNDAAGLRKKLQQLQLTVVNTQSELERSERMLKAQTDIAQDLGKEVTALHSRLSSETSGIRAKLADTEALAEARLQKIHMLEAQIKQLLHDAKAHNRKANAVPVVAADVAVPLVPSAASSLVSGVTRTSRRRPQEAAGILDDGDSSSVISDVSVEDGREPPLPQALASRPQPVPEEESLDGSIRSDMLDIAPGENSIEVYVVDATLDPACLGRFPTTFTMIDFLHFETQASPLAEGPAPAYNFSASYRVNMDAHVLRYIASTGCVIEVNQQRGADYALLARATVPMHALLGAKARVKLNAVPLRARDGKVVGSIKVELRAGIAMAEAWQAFLRDHPAEGAQLAAIVRQRDTALLEGIVDAPSLTGAQPALLADASHVQPNDLVVTIASATGLRAKSGARPPSAYIQYALPVAGSKTDQRVFPLVPTQSTLAALAAHPLQFVVCDDEVGMDADALYAAPAPPFTVTGRLGTRAATHRMILGTVQVSLASVAEGLEVGGTFDIVDEGGRAVGKLSVRVMWARPLLPIDGAPPDTITKPQFHALAALFDRDGAGVKFELALRILCSADRDALALERVREAIAAQSRDVRMHRVLAPFGTVLAAASAPSGSSSMPHRLWTDALQSAAEASGRPGLKMTPREVYDALVAPTVGTALDLPTVEDAVLTLLHDGEATVRLPDLLDAFMPPTATAAIAQAKVRRYLVPIARRQGVDFLIKTMREAAAGTSGATASSAGDISPARMSRSTFAAALKQLGLLIVEEAAPRLLARDPRAAPDFPQRATSGEEDVMQPQDYRPAPSSSLPPPAHAHTFAASSVPSAHPDLVMRSSAHELVFDLYAAADRLALARPAVPAASPAVRPQDSDAASSAVSALTPTDDETSEARDRRTAAEAGRLARRRIDDEESARPPPAPAPAPTVVPVMEPPAAPAPVVERTPTPPPELPDAPVSVYSYAGKLKRGHEGVTIAVKALKRMHPSLSKLLAAVDSSAPTGGHAFVYLSFMFPRKPVRLTSLASVREGTAAPISPFVVTLTADLRSRDAHLVFTVWPGQLDAGKAADVVTSFPMLVPDVTAPPENTKQIAATSLAEYLCGAVAAGAVPEEADVTFVLSLSPPSAPSSGSIPGSVSDADPIAEAVAAARISASDILAAGVFSLHDILDDQRDAIETTVPLMSVESYAGLLTRFAGRMRYLANEEAAGQISEHALAGSWSLPSVAVNTTLCDLSIGVTALAILERLRRR